MAAPEESYVTTFEWVVHEGKNIDLAAARKKIPDQLLLLTKFTDDKSVDKTKDPFKTFSEKIVKANFSDVNNISNKDLKLLFLLDKKEHKSVKGSDASSLNLTPKPASGARDQSDTKKDGSSQKKTEGRTVTAMLMARKDALRQRLANFSVKKGYGPLNTNSIKLNIIKTAANHMNKDEDEAYAECCLAAIQLGIAGYKNHEGVARPFMDTIVGNKYLYNILPEDVFGYQVKASMTAITPKRFCEVFADEIREYLETTPDEEGNARCMNLPRTLRFIGSKFAVKTNAEAACYVATGSDLDSKPRIKLFFKASPRTKDFDKVGKEEFEKTFQKLNAYPEENKGPDVHNEAGDSNEEEDDEDEEEEEDGEADKDNNRVGNENEDENTGGGN